MEESFQKTCSRMEANIAELEDWSHRDNIHIINPPEKIESSDALGFVSSSLPKWFPTLSGEKMELMRAHHIGPERTTGGSRTLICKMLRYTDRDQILKAARGSWFEVNGREIRFAADYGNSFSQAMESARKLGFTSFLIYPARLKLSRGSEVRLPQHSGPAD